MIKVDIELRGQNRYRVQKAQSLNSENYNSLAVLYLPCMGSECLSLYHVLVSEANKRHNDMTLERLCRLVCLPIEKLQANILKLEQFLLLKTYYSQKDESFRFDLMAPLTPARFLDNAVFSRLYLKQVGQQQYDITCQLYLPDNLQLDSDLEVTSKLDASFLSHIWDEDDEQQFVSPVETTSYNGKFPMTFDVDHFMRNVSANFFPAKLRTPENLEYIAWMGTMYSITEKDMNRILLDCVNDDGVFDRELFRYKCASCNNVDTSAVGANKYDVPPVQFLYSLQGNIPVASADKKLLEQLQAKYNLPWEVLNYAVEYQYSHNNKRISRAYLDKVAASLAVNGVDTLAKVQQQFTAPKKSNPVKNRSADFNETNFPKESEIDYDEIFKNILRKEEN